MEKDIFFRMKSDLLENLIEEHIRKTQRAIYGPVKRCQLFDRESLPSEAVQSGDICI